MKVKISAAMIAASIRMVVRRAYSGKFNGSSEIAGCWRLRDARVSRPPWRTRTNAPNTKAKARPSHRLGVKRGRTAAMTGESNAMFCVRKECERLDRARPGYRFYDAGQA